MRVAIGVAVMRGNATAPRVLGRGNRGVLAGVGLVVVGGGGGVAVGGGRGVAVGGGGGMVVWVGFGYILAVLIGPVIIGLVIVIVVMLEVRSFGLVDRCSDVLSNRVMPGGRPLWNGTV